MSTTADENITLEREFEMLMARAGADVPPERVAAIVSGYREIKRMTGLLRQPRSAASEPSNIYSLRPSVRSK